ncbi:MAG: hypothetical protein HY928_14710 [Elusimicrobia bacterium]|nr:hypothetical protein [Elusimicrobiota bacterium]
MRTLAILLTAGLACGSASAAPEGTIHDDETRLSTALQERAQGALDGVFGSGRASVQVRADLALSPEANAWLAKALRPPTAPAAGGEDPAKFNWAWMGTVAPTERDFVLPGFPDEKKRAQKAEQATAPAQRDFVDPGLVRTFGTEVLRLNARVTLDSNLPDDAAAKAEALVREAIGAADSRGDKVSVERVPMPRPWELVLRRPDLAAAIAQRLVMALLGAVLAVGLVFFGRSLERAVRGAAERLGQALQRSAERSLDLRIGGKAGLEGSGGLGALGLQALEARSAAEAGGSAAKESEPDAPPVFSIAPEEAPKLAHLLGDQPAQHVALVVPYLAPETREAFLALLGAPRASEVLGAMVPVRYVDPDQLKTLQSELERRIDGVMGGVEQAAQFLTTFPSRRRAELLKLLRERDAESAAQLRQRVLLLEDLEKFVPDELAVLTSTLSIDDLAAASVGMPEGFVAALGESLPRRTAAMFRESASLPQDPDKSAAAREALLAKAESLIAEGRLKRPPVSTVRLGSEMKP